MRKKILYLVSSLLITVSLCACSGGEVWDNKPFDTKAEPAELSDGELIAENGSYRMEWVSRNSSVRLVDKATGKIYATTPDDGGEPELDIFGLPVKKHVEVESPLVVEYLNDSTDIEEEADSYTAVSEEGRAAAELIDNGVRVKYYFDSQKIMIPVEYVLREDSIAVSINSEEIEEENLKVTSVTLLPFWCSVKNDTPDSYLFVPSGSGALVYGDTISQTGVTYAAQVYGNDPVMQADDKPVTEKAVRMPVYGAKNGGYASCAVIENAAESAVIEVNTGSSGVRYSGVYAKFQVRGYSPNLAKFMQGLEKKLNIYSRSMVKETFTVGFYPLAGDSADYSGMAEVYKNYLKKTGAFAESRDAAALDITFIGGMSVNKSFLGVPYRDLLPATTLKQVKELLSDISERTGAHINARLVGFGAGGLNGNAFAGGFKIDSALGSAAELSELSEFCRENDITLYFDFDTVSLKSGSEGYSSLFDTAYSALYKRAELYDYNAATRSRIESSKYNLLKRSELSGAVEKLLKKTDKWNIDGLSLTALGSTAYSDYSDDDSVRFYSKGNMSADVSEMLSGVRERHKVATADANVYAAVLSDAVFDVPLSSSAEQIFSEDVPFYQSVLKGFVHTSGSSYNLAEDPERRLLQTVESGAGLSFTVCAEWHKEFIDNTGYEFFGSEYAGIGDTLAETYAGLADYCEAVGGAEIIHNGTLENGLRETVFSNGVRVYVNYTGAGLSSPLGTVEGGGFIWGGGAE